MRNTIVKYNLTNSDSPSLLKVGDFFLFCGSLRIVVNDTDNENFFALDPSTGKSASRVYSSLDRLRDSYKETEIVILREVTISRGGK